MSLLSGTIACLRAGRQCGARVFLLLPPLRGKANSVRHKSCPLAEKPTVLRSFGSLTAASPWFAAAGEKEGRKSRKPLMERPPAKIEPNSIGGRPGWGLSRFQLCRVPPHPDPLPRGEREPREQMAVKERMATTHSHYFPAAARRCVVSPTSDSWCRSECPARRRLGVPHTAARPNPRRFPAPRVGHPPPVPGARAERWGSSPRTSA